MAKGAWSTMVLKMLLQMAPNRTRLRGQCDYNRAAGEKGRVRERERNNKVRADSLFGFGCSLAEWLNKGQVLFSGKLEDTTERFRGSVTS